MTPGRFVQALQSKRRAAKRRTLILWGGVAVLVVGAAVGTWLLFFSPVFAAQQVSTSGLELLTEEQVAQAAAVPVGEPLLRISTQSAEERVRELAPVDEVDVVRRFPDAIEIIVTERRMQYQRERGGQFEWIDEDGVVFHSTAEPSSGALLARSDTEEQRLLADIATVARHVPGEIRPEVEAIQADAVDQISLLLPEGRTVVWGSAEESELKAQVLEALLEIDATVFDVSAPRHPTTR
ncbi:hypothetical protein RPIT_04040 [Tessaracoccus flavus]|uniref:POTRA domain-containing protein n=1 Tax=Tessaracoccus flavus TaxID=1610493 RepID=A0A1Q2CIP3_9ACTN|nr:hypothetical protein RPIT_04040 [Tessaracoccus flavus]